MSSRGLVANVFTSLTGEGLEEAQSAADRSEKQGAVERTHRRKRLKHFRVFLFVLTNFVLHIVTFARGDRTFVLNGNMFTSIGMLGLSFVIASAVWWTMALPAIIVPGGFIAGLADSMRAQRAARRAGDDVSSGGSSGRQQAEDDLRSRVREAAEKQRAALRSASGASATASAMKGTVRVMQIIFRLYDRAEFWVARLMRVTFYCLAYIASTYYMIERSPATGRWEFGNVPTGYILVNFISLWTTFFDYTLEVLSGGWGFVTTVGSLVELATQPPIILLITLLIQGLSRLPREAIIPDVPEGEDYAVAATVGEMWQLERINADPAFYLLQFGWLRFLSLYRVNALTLPRLNVRSIRVRVASLGLAVLCIFLIIAGAMFTLEARLNGDDTFVNYFDFFYFAVVTGSTVGYGDFSPSTPLSRLICIIAIMLTLTWIPEEISQLQQAFAAKPITYGIAPRRGEPYVLLCGSVTPWQLRIFLRNFERLWRDSFYVPPQKIVVLSELGIKAYDVHSLGRSVLRRLYVHEGDVLSTLELGTEETPFQLSDAMHVFVYGDSGDSLAEDDSRAVLRVLALLNFTKKWSITCMLGSATNLTMVMNMGVHNVLCINDLTMRWIGKTITDTPGIVCLMANLLSSSSEWGKADRDSALALFDLSDSSDDESLEYESAPPSVEATPAPTPPATPGSRRAAMRKATTASSESHSRKLGGAGAGAGGRARAPKRDDRSEYLHGAQSQLLVHPLPHWALRPPQRASWLYEQMVSVDGIQLLALRDRDNMHIWRWDDELRLHEHMTGVWMARSERQLAAFLRSPRPPRPSPAGAPGAASSRLASAAQAASAVARSAPLSLGQPQHGARGGGGARARSMTSVSTDELEVDVTHGGGGGGGALAHGDRIVVCGWPPDIEKLLTILLEGPHASANDIKVTHIATCPYASTDDVGPAMRHFTEHRDIRLRYQRVEANALDRDVLKAHVLPPGLHSVVIFPHNLRPSGDPMDAIVCAAKVESMLMPRHSVRVVVALSSTSHMRFVERSSWWPADDDVVVGHLTSPTFAAGNVIADEMLFPLMMGWSKEGLMEFCTRLTDETLDPVQLKLFDLPPDLAARASASAPSGAERGGGGGGGAPSSASKGAGRHGSLCNGAAAATQLTRYAATATRGRRGTAHARSYLTYEELSRELLALGLLPMGLLRQRQQLTDRALRSLPYVYTNPPNSLRIRSTDRVFALIKKKGMIENTSSRKVVSAAKNIQQAWRELQYARWEHKRRWPDTAPSDHSIKRENDSFDDAAGGAVTGAQLEDALDRKLDQRMGPLEDRVRAMHDELARLSERLLVAAAVSPRSAKGGAAVATPALAPPGLSAAEREQWRRSARAEAGADPYDADSGSARDGAASRRSAAGSASAAVSSSGRGASLSALMGGSAAAGASSNATPPRHAVSASGSAALAAAAGDSADSRWR